MYIFIVSNIFLHINMFSDLVLLVSFCTDTGCGMLTSAIRNKKKKTWQCRSRQRQIESFLSIMYTFKFLDSNYCVFGHLQFAKQSDYNARDLLDIIRAFLAIHFIFGVCKVTSMRNLHHIHLPLAIQLENEKQFIVISCENMWNPIDSSPKRAFLKGSNIYRKEMVLSLVDVRL